MYYSWQLCERVNKVGCIGFYRFVKSTLACGQWIRIRKTVWNNTTKHVLWPLSVVTGDLMTCSATLALPYIVKTRGPWPMHLWSQLAIIIVFVYSAFCQRIQSAAACFYGIRKIVSHFASPKGATGQAYHKLPYSFNKCPEHLDKSVWVGAYLFHYWLQGSTQKWMILAGFKLILRIWEMVDYFMVSQLGCIKNVFLQNIMGGRLWGRGWLFERLWFNFLNLKKKV